MKNISENIKRKLNVLLQHLETESMEREQMAFFVGMNYKNFCKYATYLRKTKQIYICGYRGNSVLYMAGNKPDAKRPKLSQYEMRKASKLRKAEELKAMPKVRMDIAASWMFNPC